MSTQGSSSDLTRIATKDELPPRPRSRTSSQTSLAATMDFYGVNRTNPTSQVMNRRPSGSNTATPHQSASNSPALTSHHSTFATSGSSSAAAAPTSPPPPSISSSSLVEEEYTPSIATTSHATTYQAHSASILPSSSFLNPVKPMGVRSTLLAAHQQSNLSQSTEQQQAPPISPITASLPRNNWRTAMLSSGATSSAGATHELGLRPSSRQGQSQGPTITRVTSPTSFVSGAGTATPRPLSPEPSIPSPRPFSPTNATISSQMMRRTSSDMSREEMESDLYESGAKSVIRLGQLGRTASNEQVIQKWESSRSIKDDSSSSHHVVGHHKRDLSSGTMGRVIPRTSKEPLLGPRRSESRNSGRAIEMDSLATDSIEMKRKDSQQSRTSLKSPATSKSITAEDWNDTVATRVAAQSVNAQGRTSDQEHDESPNLRATFIPVEPKPVLDSSGRPLRNYELHQGSNRFFLEGRILSSGDNPTPFLISLTLAILMPILFIAFSGPFLWQHLGGGGKASIFIFIYLALLMWVNMLKTSWTDPGIIPRSLDPTPERKWIDDLNGDGQGGWKVETKYMRIREGVVATKWCETCQSYRPPRTSHCRLCDNCVEHTDHHCTFLNNCIGRRNYTPFIAFLISAVLCGVYAISFSAWHISRRHQLSQIPTDPAFGKPWSTRWDVVGSFIVTIVAFILLCPIIGLFGYHAKLLWINSTTIEMLRPKGLRTGAINPADGTTVGNVYSLRTPWQNITYALCRPVDVPSWLAPKEIALRDERGNRVQEIDQDG